MAQKEFMKKTRIYGLMGLLVAVLLVATVYSISNTPSLPQPSPSVTSTPNSSPFPSITPFPSTSPEPEVTPMRTFTSYDELKEFLNQSKSQNVYAFGTVAESRLTAGTLPQSTNADPALAPIAAQSTGTKDFSATNIQVAGIDEADTVKTDGKFLYVIGDNNKVVYILDANPQNFKVLGKIFLNNTYLSGIYLSQDGSKLAVVGSQYVVNYLYDWTPEVASSDLILPYWNSGTNFVKVYDVSNKANPVLTRNFTMSGSYVNSRMIGNYIYDVVTENAYMIANGTVTLPTVFSGSTAYNVEPTKIYYANSSDTSYSYTTILALNIMNDAAPPSNMTIMMGGAGTIYVSQSNIYITYPVMNYRTIVKLTPTAVPMPMDLGKNGTDIAVSIAPMPIIWMPTWQGTAIYRIHISGDSLTFAAQGNVTGNVLSQYSMDENNGYFRIATTSYDYNTNTGWGGIQQNNLYVLNSDLKIVGKIENLASGESLHAARFMGTRCYLVTFQQVDPLFVIDLSQPTNPKVLGNLTIPGYSDFLQPYDATHLIGIGQDVNASIDADKVHTPGAVYYTAILGLKVSLFDVSDVTNPKEISKFVVGDRGTTSEALNDPKAILFDASRNLLVLPVDLYLASNNTASPSLPPNMPRIDSSFAAYPQFAWQGVYVFNITINGGLVVRGNVTQMDNAAALLTNPSLALVSSYQWVRYDQFISRSLYIGNVLYTFSDSRVQLNSLDNLAPLAKIDLN